MTTLERTDADYLLDRYAVKPEQVWSGWADHRIDWKVGPARAELHSSSEGFRDVYSVFVKEKKRGQGHGRRLMDVIVAYAEATGCGLSLTVYAHNEPAVRLYTSVGFRITHTRDDVHYMDRYPSHIPNTEEWTRHFEAKALYLEREHEPRMGGDFWIGFFADLYKAQMGREDLDRKRYTGSPNYEMNTRRLSCDASGALLTAAGWTITRTEES